MRIHRVGGVCVALLLVVSGCTSTSGEDGSLTTVAGEPTTIPTSTTTTAVPVTTVPVAATVSPSTSVAPAMVIVEGTDTFVSDTESLGPLRWTRFEIPDGDTPPFVAVDPQGGYIAHGDGGETGLWSETVMHSQDGSAWRILSGTEAASAMVRVDTSYSPPDTGTLPGLVGKAGHGSVFEGDFGFLAYGNDTVESGSLVVAWVSSNGRDWETVALPPDTGYDGGQGAAGDIIFKSSDYHGDDGSFSPMVLWVGRFET